MKWFVDRDVDGFFGLFVDNLVQLLLITALCQFLCGMTGADSKWLYNVILPGAAVSIVLGNVFYSIQAILLGRREKRDDVTALPYGINTPSLLVFIFFVMEPTYRATKSAEAAWKMGVLACLGSGIIEFLGSFVAEWLRRHTPRAALLSTLSGIAIGFISMTFALQIWSRPLVAMAPLAIVLVTYFAHYRFPLSLPGGLVAIVVGTAIAWIPASVNYLAPGSLDPKILGVERSFDAVVAGWNARHWSPPTWQGGPLWEVLQTPAQWVGFLSVIIPMGLFNVIGSLQNIESAEASGDKFDTRSSLAVNGIGTIAAALFGSCFPTTIYIGHPGWKGLGARAGYSVLNGIAITAICLTGTLALVQSVIPLEAGIAIVLWIGVIITAQAFQSTPPAHAPAVATGLFPAIAAWGATVAFGAFVKAGGQSMQTVLSADASAELSGFLLHGLIVMERGYIFTCMILGAVSACLIDRKFFAAAIWSLVGSIGSALGLMHAYLLNGNVVDYLLVGMTPPANTIAFRAWDLAIGYLLLALLFSLIALHARSGKAIFTAEGH